MAKRKDQPIETICVTRAEFEAKFGYKPSREAIGVRIGFDDGIFLQVEFATPEDEVATLEAIYEL